MKKTILRHQTETNNYRKRNKLCLLCKNLEESSMKSVVKKYKSCTWILNPNQLYKGYSFLILNAHVEHLHELHFFEMISFFITMISIGKKLYKNLHPLRINYEILGNKIPHLHVHIIPRYKTDPQLLMPIWSVQGIRKEKPASIDEINRIKELLI